MPRTSSRRQTPQSPPKPRVEVSTPIQTRRSTRKQGHDLHEVSSEARPDKHVQPALRPVPELEDTIEVVAAAAAAAHRVEPGVSRDDDDEDSYISSQTSDENSERVGDEFDDLDRDLMIELLTVINEDADNVFETTLNFRSLQDEHADAKATGRIRKRLAHQLERLKGDLQRYGTGTLFLQPWKLTAYLVGHSDSPDAVDVTVYAGFEAILMKANLARLAAELVTIPEIIHSPPVDILVYLNDIDVFPRPFVAQERADGTVLENLHTTLVDDTLEVGLGILTYRVVTEILRRGANYNIDDLLEAAFFDETGHPRDIGYGVVSENDQEHQLEDLIEQRTEEIKSFTLLRGIRMLDLQSLLAKLPWSDFVHQLVAWASLRMSELDRAITNQGGVETIKRQLNNERASSDAPVGSEIDHFVAQSSDRSAVKAVSNQEYEEATRDLAADYLEGEELTPEEEAARAIEAEMLREARQDVIGQHVRDHHGGLLAKEAETSARLDSPEVDESEINESEIQRELQLQSGDTNVIVSGFDEPEAAEEEDSDRPVRIPITPTPQSTLLAEKWQQAEREGNKENRPNGRTRPGLLDRQENATRVEFDSPVPETGPSERRKRGRGINEESDGDEEDEFETDQRIHKKNRIEGDKNVLRVSRARGQRTISAQPEPQERIGTQEMPGGLSPLPQSSQARMRTQTVRGASVEHEPGVPPPSTADDWQMARREGRYNVAEARAVRSLAIHPPQNRRPWEADEVKRLIDLMVVHGSSWVNILEADARMVGPQLQSRSNVQLKDKARNIKFDFLKAERALPRGFEYVKITPHQRRILDEIGIPHEAGEV